MAETDVEKIVADFESFERCMHAGNVRVLIASWRERGEALKRRRGRKKPEQAGYDPYTDDWAR